MEGEDLWNNDFEIIEHEYAEEEEEGIVYQPNGFPDVKHRSLLPFDLGRDGDEYPLKDIESMTKQEIEEAQRYLHEKLGEDMCNFLIQKKLKSMKETTSAVEDTGTQCLVFNFNEEEASKLEWTEPINEEYSKGDKPLHLLKFNIHGECLERNTEPISQTNDPKPAITDGIEAHFIAASRGVHPSYSASLTSPGNFGLVKHQEITLEEVGLADAVSGNSREPNCGQSREDPQSSYTIPQFLCLSQSGYKQQAQLGIRALRCILRGSCGDYYGYGYNRWSNYIYRDIDLVSKVGFLICDNLNNVRVLSDSLDCLASLLLGNSSLHVYGYEFDLITTAKDRLYSYYHNHYGLNVYHWSKLSLEIPQFLVDGEITLSEGFGDLPEFYFKALNGDFESLAVDEIRNLYLKEDRDVLLDPKLFLLTKFNLISKLLSTMRKFKENSQIQIGATRVICGLIIEFKTYLTDALLKFKPFLEYYKQLIIKLSEGIPAHVSCPARNTRLHSTPGDHSVLDGSKSDTISGSTDEVQEVSADVNAVREYNDRQNVESLHLRYVILSLLKYLSIYSSGVFGIFVESGISLLIKQVMTCAYSNELYRLGLIQFPYDIGNFKELYSFSASVSVECMEIWAIKGECFDHLDEFVPVLDLLLCGIIKNFAGSSVVKDIPFICSLLRYFRHMKDKQRYITLEERVSRVIEVLRAREMKLDFEDLMINDLPFNNLNYLYYCLSSKGVEGKVTKEMINYIRGNLEAFLNSYSRELILNKIDDELLALLSSDDEYLGKTLRKLSVKYGIKHDLVEEVYANYKKFASLIQTYATLTNDNAVKPSFLTFLINLPIILGGAKDIPKESNITCESTTLAKNVSYSPVENLPASVTPLENRLEEVDNTGLRSAIPGIHGVVEDTISNTTFTQGEINRRLLDTIYIFSSYVCDNLDWYPEDFIFEQLVYRLSSGNCAHVSSNYVNHLQVFFFNKLVSVEKIYGDVDLLKRVLRFENSNYFRKYFGGWPCKDICVKLIDRFTSGECDNVISIGLLLIFLTEPETSKLLWSNETLMLLLGRNLTLDPETLNISCNTLDTLNIGHIKHYLAHDTGSIYGKYKRDRCLDSSPLDPNPAEGDNSQRSTTYNNSRKVTGDISEKSLVQEGRTQLRCSADIETIVNLHKKMLHHFSSLDIENLNPIAFIVLHSIINHSNVELRRDIISSVRDDRIRKILEENLS